MSRVVVVGLGFVGLTTALGFAEAGHEVVGVEADPAKRAAIESGTVPFFEPGLPEALQRHLGGRFSVASSIAEALPAAGSFFFCVGTPSGDDGHADLSILDAAITGALDALRAAGSLDSGAAPGTPGKPMLVVKSTVPPGTCAEHVVAVIRAAGFEPRTDVGLANNPEFLREGYSWEDFTRPDRVVIGACDEVCGAAVAAIYEPFGVPVHVTTLSTAEFVKYLSNTLLSTLISWANETSMIADAVGGIETAAAYRILHEDKRWSGAPANMAAYAFPGAGFGGYCLPKDTAALAGRARERGVEPKILDAVLAQNLAIKTHVAEKVEALVAPGGTVGVLGLAFKPGSDDVRDTPSAAVIAELLVRGVKVVAYDPLANELFAAAYPEFDIDFAETLDACVEAADALVLMTAWPEFRERADLLRSKPLLDARYALS